MRGEDMEDHKTQTIAGVVGTGVAWLLTNGTEPEDLGFIYEFLSAHDPDSAAAQFDKNYAHGGGWRPTGGFALHDFEWEDAVRGKTTLRYTGDPPLKMKAMAVLHEELLIFFEAEFMAIVGKDGQYEVARLD